MADSFLFSVEVGVEGGGADNGSIRIRDRYSSPGNVNIDGRTGAVAPPASSYELQIVLQPALIGINDTAIVRFLALRNGLPLGLTVVEVLTDNPAVGDVPGTLTLGSDGRGSFSLIGKQNGSASLRGRMMVDGVETYSLPVVLTVNEDPAKINYPMSGWGKVVMTLETPFANALFPHIERLSHQEQQRKFPGDRGLEYATAFENETVVFLPKVLLE